MGDQITEIGDRAFVNCSRLETIKLNNVETIGIGAFVGCSELNIVNNLSKVKTIDDFAFNGCKSLNIVDLSGIENADAIGIDAFNGSGLSSVTLPKASNNEDKARVKAIKDKIRGQVKKEITFINDPESNNSKSNNPESAK